MSHKTTPFDGNYDDLSDKRVLAMVLEGTLTRNKNFEFFKTKRGQDLFRKARIIKGFIQDLDKGAEIIGEDKEKESILITIENNEEKYKRTVFMDETMYSVFVNRKQ
jgi:hypothetical protein